jgi:hypothetical protein
LEALSSLPANNWLPITRASAATSIEIFFIEFFFICYKSTLLIRIDC